MFPAVVCYSLLMEQGTTRLGLFGKASRAVRHTMMDSMKERDLATEFKNLNSVRVDPRRHGEMPVARGIDHVGVGHHAPRPRQSSRRLRLWPHRD